MPRPHPLLDIHHILDASNLRSLSIVLFQNSFGLIMPLKVAPKVLKKCHLFLEFFGIFLEGVGFADILPITRPSLHIIQMMPVGIQNHFGGIVEKHPSSIIRKIVAQAIFG